MENLLLTPDKEKNYQSYMVFALTIIWSLATSLVVVVGFFYFPLLWSRWVLLLTIAIVIAVSNLALNYYGHTRTASWLLCTMLWFYITIPCITAGGIFAPGILSQTAIILTAGFLLGRRGGLAIGLLTIVADFLLAWLELNGHLPETVVLHDPFSRWISAIIPFGTVMVLQYYAIDHLRKSLTSMQREMVKRRNAEAAKDDTSRELSVREQELQDYKYALDISSIVAISNVEGTFTYVNENFCKVSKYTSEELIGKPHTILLSGVHPPEYFIEMGNAMLAGKPFRGEFCNRAKDGSLYWVDSTVVPFLDDKGEVYQFISINRDITEKKEAEEQLRANKERYKSIIAVSNTGAWEYDHETNKVWHSAQYFSMLGYDEPQGVWEGPDSLSWVTQLHPEDKERAVEVFDDFMKGNDKDIYENIFRMRHKNGDWVWILSRAKRLLDKDGNITNICLGTHTNITERVKADDKIRETEQLIKKITSQVPGNTYMFEIEESGMPNILFVNRGAEEFNFRADLNDISADAAKILEVWHPDDRALFTEKMKEARLTTGRISFQYRVIVNDAIRWRWLQATPEEGKDGKMIWYGATRDITDLVDYIASAEQILFDISHVLRRPVSSMLALTTLINEGDLDVEEVLHFARQLHPVALEMDKFMIELNEVYERKRKVNTLNIDFHLLVDKRNSLFDRSNGGMKL
ncbi:PAS domain-containing protein [Mucilaginibacter auburnensis]|uniref:histidine kinase n=1 Tax=Mucilaginibacter auburnensis TaxID=1457233 RepID=A0A2H9VMZ1_9SPHI|nr:PAS domain-containing protein [Mucilaginibacter auburnensis]PJJ79688.1 PAS domain S-box-containing protein [Mucilaginibacter auburnensis]